MDNTKLKEIDYTKKQPPPNTDMRCPKCNGEMSRGSIPCPEGIPGCLVYHIGYMCIKCGSVFQ